MEKVIFSLTFKEKERKNIYEKEEILFFASKCPTDPRLLTNHIKPTNVCILPSLMNTQEILLTHKS